MLLWPLSQMHWHLLVLSQGGYKLQLLLLYYYLSSQEKIDKYLTSYLKCLNMHL